MSAQGLNHCRVIADAVLVTKNVRMILLQGDIDSIPELPNLPSHQRAVRTHSKTWDNEIWPLMLKATTSIIHFGSEFNVCYKILANKLKPKLQEGDEQAKGQFIDLVEILLENIKEQASEASEAHERIKEFYENMKPLYDAFEKDYNVANDVLTRDNDELKSKQNDLEDWEAKAETYIQSAIAMGAALPATAEATAAFSSSGVALIIGGVLLAGEMITLTTMLGLYGDAMHHIHQLNKQIRDLESEVADLTHIKSQIKGLKRNTYSAVVSSRKVALGWETLKTDLEKMVQQLKVLTPENAFELEGLRLARVNEQWKVVMKQAENLKPGGNGQLEDKNYKDGEELLNAIDEQTQGA